MKPIEFDKSFIKAYKKRIVHDQKLKKRFGLRFAQWQSGNAVLPYLIMRSMGICWGFALFRSAAM